MDRLGVLPNLVTYNAALLCCAYAGQADRAFELFKVMDTSVVEQRPRARAWWVRRAPSR
jgi:pentatricopeptide repeat protein